MDYKSKLTVYEQISPGTIGVSQKVSMEYNPLEDSLEEETSKLVFLSRNEVMPCSHNQY